MLAVTELELLSPGEGFGDVHMDILRRLQPDQDEGPDHAMQNGEGDDQPEVGFSVACAFHEPRRQPPEHGPPARA